MALRVPSHSQCSLGEWAPQLLPFREPLTHPHCRLELRQESAVQLAGRLTELFARALSLQVMPRACFPYAPPNSACSVGHLRVTDATIMGSHLLGFSGSSFYFSLLSSGKAVQEGAPRSVCPCDDVPLTLVLFCCCCFTNCGLHYTLSLSRARCRFHAL